MSERFSGLDRAIAFRTWILFVFIIAEVALVVAIQYDARLAFSAGEWIQLGFVLFFDTLLIGILPLTTRRELSNIYNDILAKRNSKTKIAPSQSGPESSVPDESKLFLQRSPTAIARWIWLIIGTLVFAAGLSYDRELIAHFSELPSSLLFIHLVIVIVPGLFLMLGIIPNFTVFFGQSQKIWVDDTGIIVWRRWYGSRQLLWREIRGVYRTDANGKESVYSTLHLFSEKQHIRFQILSAMTNENIEHYVPIGRAEFINAAYRLLATITSRTKLLIFVDRKPSDLLAALSSEDIVAFPYAASALQPTTSIMALQNANLSQVLLQERVKWGKYWRNSIIFSIFIVSVIAVIFGILSVQWSQGPHIQPANLNTELIIPIAILLGFICVMSVIVMLPKNLAVVANNMGIRQRRQKEIPWRDIRAWAIYIPEQPSLQSIEYIVFTRQQTLRWKEPADAQLAGRGVQGDRRAAYRERAEQLHAMIAVHTGLQLREIPTS